MKKFIFILFSLFQVYSICCAEVENLDTVMLHANNCYSNADYAGADSLYSMIAESSESVALYYNLGNSKFKQGQLGKALVAYRKAHNLDPSDADVIHNMEIVRSRTVDHLQKKYDSFFSGWLQSAANKWSSNSWAVIAIILFWIAILGAVFFLFFTQENIRRIGLYGGLTMFLFSIVSTYFSYLQKSNHLNENECVVVVDAAYIRSSPENEAKSILILHEGAELHISDKIGTFYEIELNNGSKGWILNTDVDII